MDGQYAECSVKRNKGLRTTAYKLLIIIIFIYILYALARFTGLFYTLLGGALGIYLIAFIFKRFNVEYEYVFCDGQVDFDVIKAANKRKHMLRIELSNAELFAPLDDDEIRRTKTDTVCNYYSESNIAKPYALIVRKNDKMLKVIMEPSAKFMRCMKFKMPRKCRFYEEDEKEINSYTIEKQSIDIQEDDIIAKNK